ncbi:restriction endonuclease subunit S [Marinomonas gallaica]|uniref:restriction endonuclease subunit S n=1 Tax=Marinomonas gallaica TaxID=1806667 RepID=UPI003CE49251
MSLEKKVPEIRFQGFSDEWREIVIGTACSNFRSGKFIKAEDIKKSGDYPVYGGNGLRGFTSEYNHDGTYALIGRQGALCGNMNYSCGKAFFTEHAIAVQANEKNDTLFLYYKLGLMNLGQYSGQSAQPGLSVNKLTELEDFTPVKPEQTAIGTYFQKLDNLINQHKQKHDKLSNIKKAMLEKMFPKQGETIPEIRFKGFSGEWVLRSWRDTVDISTNMVDPRSSQYGELLHVGPGNIESFTGMFYNNVLKVKDSNLISGKFHFNKGDILYGKINPQLAKYVIAPFEGLASADAYVLSAKNGVVQNYLYAILQTDDFYKYTVSVSSRTGMPKINRDELNIYSYLSPDEAEQQRIGNYFQKLDALINQHQQQIIKLNNIKQACLSKMFV